MTPDRNNANTYASINIFTIYGITVIPLFIKEVYIGPYMLIFE